MGESPGTCLVLDRVNNIQERKQSPLAGRIERSVNGKYLSECGGAQESQMAILSH